MAAQATRQPTDPRLAEFAKLSAQEQWQRAFASFPSFCGMLQIQPKEGLGRIPFVLSKVQLAYCRARSRRDIIVKPRQVHMTTVECAKDFHWFLEKPGAKVVVVVQSQDDQAPLKEVSGKIALFIRSLRDAGFSIPLTKESAYEWHMASRDATLRVIQAGESEAAAAKKGRAGTVNRLHISEAAFYGSGEDTFNALNESVPREGSEIVIESTANGASGWFYSMWRAAVEGRSAYKPHFFPWWMHDEYRFLLEPGERLEPANDIERYALGHGATAENIKWYRWKASEKGDNVRLILQEFPSDPDTCFLQSGRGFFDADTIAALQREAVDHPPIHTQIIRGSGVYGQVIAGREVPAIRVWHEPVKGLEYVLSLDVSAGAGLDAGAGIVRERGTGRHMATIWGQFKPFELAKIGALVAQKYNWAVIAVERNNNDGCIRALVTEAKYPAARIFCDRDEKQGWLTSTASRPAGLSALETAVRRGTAKTCDPFLLNEMSNFIVNDKGKEEASPGNHDDLVMADMICWDVLTRVTRSPASVEGLVA